MTISQRIFGIMEQKHLKQSDLANYIGVANSSVSDWKKKGSTPSADKIVKISEFLNVSIDYLLGRTDNKNGYSNNSNSFNNGDNSTQAIGDCNNISTNISSSDKNNMYNDIIEHLDTLSKSDRFRAIADITDILEEKYPVKKN